MSEWTAEIAEWYAEKYGEYATNRVGVDRLPLHAGTAVLDVGCGTGAALRHAAARVGHGRLVGIDPVPRMVEIARQQCQGHPGSIRVVVGSAEDLPVGDAEFDVVMAFDSFDHWAHPQRGLAEVRRALRPGGLFAVVKDGGVPSLRPFHEAVETAGFTVEHKERIEEQGVIFTLWLCRP